MTTISDSTNAPRRPHKPGIPIVFFQVGRKDDIDIALRQASLAAPASDLILITDEIRDLDVDVLQFRLDDCVASFGAFRDVYIHASVNPYGFELLCFARWFMMLDLCRKIGLERLFVIDSDVLLYQPPEVVAKEFRGYCAGSWAGTNYFDGLEGLEAICRYFLDVYSDRRTFIKVAAASLMDGIPQVSDMSLLLDLAAGDPRFLDMDTLMERGFDPNIRTSSNGIFDMHGPIKLIVFDDDGIPYCRRSDNGRPVDFKILHFQGCAKKIMDQFAWPITA